MSRILSSRNGLKSLISSTKNTLSSLSTNSQLTLLSYLLVLLDTDPFFIVIVFIGILLSSSILVGLSMQQLMKTLFRSKRPRELQLLVVEPLQQHRQTITLSPSRLLLNLDLPPPSRTKNQLPKSQVDTSQARRRTEISSLALPRTQSPEKK